MKQKWLLIIISAIVLIGGLAAGSYFFLNRANTEPKTEPPVDETGQEPTETTYYENGEIELERWYIDGLLHRENDRPAKRQYYENGEILYETWYIDGQEHRENDRPAEIWYYENGEIKSKAWYIDGQEHRENDRPAEIWYYENGEILYEVWYLNGELIKEKPFAEPTAFVEGKIIYPGKLPPGSVIEIKLLDITPQQAKPVPIADKLVIENPSQSPIAYKIGYHTDNINEGNTYRLFVYALDSEGRLLLHSATRKFITQDNPAEIDLRLEEPGMLN